MQAIYVGIGKHARGMPAVRSAILRRFRKIDSVTAFA
jgi:hypothetical protein